MSKRKSWPEEPGRTEMNRREKHALEMIIIAANELAKKKGDLKERLDGIDRKQYRMMCAALGMLLKVQTNVLDTIPTPQLIQLRTVCGSGCVAVMPDPTLLPAGHTMVLDRDLNRIMGEAVNNKCALCVLDDMACRQCELRKVLMTYWPPKKLPRYGGCPYQRVEWKLDGIGEDEEESE